LIQGWTNGDSPDKNIGDSGIQKFWAAAVQYSNNKFQTAVFFGMVFTIIIWVISFIGLAIAFILYVMFLWHHIPRQDGGLRGYCKRKVDKSVGKIVSAKIKKALEKEQQQQGNKKGAKRRDVLPDAPIDSKRQPTVPILGDEESGLPPYASRPETPSSMFDRQPTLPGDMPGFARPGMPGRTATGVSNMSHGSDAPLLSGAADYGYGEPGRSYSPVNGRSASPAPPRPFTPTGDLVPGRIGSPGPQRSMTPMGGPPRQPMNGYGPPRSYTPAGPPPLGAGGRPPAPTRQQTGLSDYSTGRPSPGPGQSRQLTPGPPGPGGMQRTGTAMSGLQNGRSTPMGPQPPRLNTPASMNSQGRQSPASFNRPGGYGGRGPGSVQEYEMQPTSRQATPNNGGYQAYQPGVASPSTPGSADRQPLMGLNSPMGGIQRSGTAPLVHHESTYGDSILDDYADNNGTQPHPLHRAATSGPGNGHGPAWQ